MRVRFRLNELLTGLGVTQHGRITLIKNSTGIERHKVSDLIDGTEDKISLKQLGELCRFLIEQCGVDPQTLPGALFEIEPNEFLQLLRSTPSLRTCFGVRQQRAVTPWAAGADSYLQGRMLELLLLPEATVQQEDTIVWSDRHLRDATLRRVGRTQIRHFHQEQVLAVSVAALRDEQTRETELELLRHDAERVYQVLHTPPGPAASNRKRDAEVKQVALILGSVKSNPVCELSLARMFGAEAWQVHGRRASARKPSGSSAKLVVKPSERAVPVFIRYRDGDNSPERDPQVPSCYAGLRLAQKLDACGGDDSVAGIYYETADGCWRCIPCNASTDGAIIIYDYDRLLGNVEIVMGGFSGKATWLLGENLEWIVDRLSEGRYETAQRVVGAYVVHFDVEPVPAAPNSPPAHPRLAQRPKVIPLDPEVLRSRLG